MKEQNKYCRIIRISMCSYQLNIPKPLAHKLGLKKGTNVLLEDVGGYMVITLLDLRKQNNVKNKSSVDSCLKISKDHEYLI